MEIIGEKSEDVWKKALRHVHEKGKDFTDKDGRTCREVLNLCLTVKNTEGITKPIETINSFRTWVYPPLDELKAIALSKKEIPGYYYNYGARAFNFGAINQIDDYVIPLLKKDGTSRRASIVFYDPEKDSFLHKRDIPGMVMMGFNIREGKLNATALVRSNDLFFGWPANIYQTFVIQEYIAKELGCEKGSITTFSISAHIFEDQFDHVKKVI
jgi:thymidylate synthase